jgi:endonuclease YncB( thermonuclease family)
LNSRSLIHHIPHLYDSAGIQENHAELGSHLPNLRLWKNEESGIYSLRRRRVDTSERGKPDYEEAKECNAKLVLDKKVTLKLDVQVRDKYGRLLAYVYLEDEKPS